MGFFDRFKGNKSNANENFWTWFVKHKDRIAGLLDGDTFERATYAQLTREIQRVHPRIMPELTRDADGTHVLVISADGCKEAVEPVVQLAHAAPTIKNWRVERFRKPAPEGMRIDYEGLDIDPADVRVAIAVDKELPLVHIGMVIPGYNASDKRFIGVGFLYLDHTIGEYNTIMHTGHIDLMAPGDVKPGTRLLDLVQLRELIEERFY